MPMTRQVLFVQGGGAGVHDAWDSRLVASLTQALGAGAGEIRYPRMPSEHDPRYAPWKDALEKEFATLDERALLVGHSIGGTLLIHALADPPTRRRFGAVLLLAAPFVGDGGWPADESMPMHDLGACLPRDMPIHLFHGLADETVPVRHLALYAQAIPHARVHRLPGRDHQFNDDLRDVARVIRSLDAPS